MGRHGIKPMNYAQITNQAEKTVAMLMLVASDETNCTAARDQSVSRALGAVVLWEDLTATYVNTEDDKKRLYSMLACPS